MRPDSNKQGPVCVCVQCNTILLRITLYFCLTEVVVCVTVMMAKVRRVQPRIDANLKEQCTCLSMFHRKVLKLTKMMSKPAVM